MATTKATTLAHTLGGIAGSIETAEINRLDGVNADIQTQLDNLDTNKAPKASPTFTGDSVFDTDTLKVDSTANKVGIGVSGTPEAKLDVKVGSAGSVTAWTEADDLILESNAVAGISILTPDDSASRLVFGSPSSNQGAALFYRQNLNKMNVGTLQSGGALALRSGANVDAVVIDGNQNVGIGNTAPEADLHIGSYQSGTGQTATIRLSEGNGAGASTGFDIKYVGNANPDGLYFTSKDGGGTFVNRMVITRDDGNVGIGDINPPNPLSVNGSMMTGRNEYSGSPGTGSFNIASLSRIFRHTATLTSANLIIAYCGTNSADAGFTGHAFLNIYKSFGTYSYSTFRNSLTTGNSTAKPSFTLSSSYLSAQSSGGYNYTGFQCSWCVLGLTTQG